MLGRRVLVAALVVTLSGCAWAQYRGDAAHTGYQPFESAIGVSNVSALAESWSSSNADASGVVAGGVLYAPGVGGVRALDAAGVNGCSGSPKVCSPLWTGEIPLTNFVSTPAVSSGIVYVNVSSGMLLAFDAAGVHGCDGAPKICTPLWSAEVTEGGALFGSPTIASGVVYVGDGRGYLYAFDGAGIAGCSGAPKTCAPLWKALGAGGGAGTPTVASGLVYIGGLHKLAAFDASGVNGCSGVPKICAPLWTAAAPDRIWTLAVADGVVFASGNGTTTGGELDAFDAAGITGCSGVPKTCAPLWTATTTSFLGNPSVATGTVYATSLQGTLFAYDAKGVQGCSGTPKTCVPKWTADMHATAGWSPTVANGVVYAPTFNKLLAFEATGARCPGTPGVCQPLLVSPSFNAGLVDPIVVNGTVFVYSQDGTIHALRLPA